MEDAPDPLTVCPLNMHSHGGRLAQTTHLHHFQCVAGDLARSYLARVQLGQLRTVTIHGRRCLLGAEPG